MKPTWLITGAASGLGRALALNLARRGERLVLWDRDAEGLAQVAALAGPHALRSDVVDVVQPEQVREAAARAADEAFPLLKVIHCAGILRVGPALKLPAVDYRAMMEVNYLGSVHVARALVPILRDAARPKQRGQLALVASLAAFRGMPELAGYSASKAAVLSFAEALRDELRDAPVDVRVVCPPPLDTPMVRNLPELPPIYRLSPPTSVEETAKDVLAKLEGRDFIVLLGKATRLLWHAQHVAPLGVDFLLSRLTRTKG
jgi:NAD(P)-dependent dehydrogenase (short-subunit alcohol dehydrogenase family)